MSEDMKSLLNKIRALDLALIDTGLYLNAYPDKEAAAYFKTVCEEREALADHYQKACAPLTKCHACPIEQWTQTPWPWEWEAD
ncbi:MAG: spore coat protein CotJB [Clostridia bacterium]|nr:spore coat protein CotJB [Clostridia bacterium]